MPKYGFSLNSIFPYKDTGKHGSEKIRILACFTQCNLPTTTSILYLPKTKAHMSIQTLDCDFLYFSHFCNKQTEK